MKKTAAIIVAAGRGQRAGGDTPKQWRTVAGRRVLDWTLDAFRAMPEIDEIVIVHHYNDLQYVSNLSELCVLGGDTRDASVRNGLNALVRTEIPPDRVLIHDAARPLVSRDLIMRVLNGLDDNHAAAPALPVVDALWFGNAEGNVESLQDRSGLYRAQTPQGFRFASILAAHEAFVGIAADDVEVAKASGIDVQIVLGDENNLKITTPADFARADQLLRGTKMDVRTGNGFDVHRFGDGDHVILCGVTIPYARGLQGHSDADVGMHAITDAIYGALGDGDIGQHFPPSDPQWKGAASEIFLKNACALAEQRNFKITNIDCTLICENPKIGPHASDMKLKLSEITQVNADRISVKATTSERLGFTGRGEGIASIATITLVQA
jgi:2-C-methyl-D-erythritol 4-phosphate cytidylyltransferase / 2-C-methyl-D-erythritol 2,4-cyclodiphosphate synthase